jgi:hypothetical protein
MEERFSRLEEKVYDISRNMTLLMEYLTKKFRPFGDVCGSNSEARFHGKLGDSEDLENKSRKEPKK